MGRCISPIRASSFGIMRLPYGRYESVRSRRATQQCQGQSRHPIILGENPSYSQGDNRRPPWQPKTGQFYVDEKRTSLFWLDTMGLFY